MKERGLLFRDIGEIHLWKKQKCTITFVIICHVRKLCGSGGSKWVYNSTIHNSTYKQVETKLCQKL